MESFDTILDQLKQAQDRGRAAVEGQFENISARLSQLVDEATASVRENLVREAEELFPIEDLKKKVEGFRDQFAGEVEEKDRVTAQLADAEARLREAETIASGPGGAEGGPALSLLRALDEARSQSELLRELLPALCDVAGRAVVVVIRGEDVSAWSGIGFGDGEVLRSWKCRQSQSRAIAQLIAEQKPVAFNPDDDPVFAQWLAGEEAAEHALIVPVSLRGNLMGCMYLDDGGDGPWNPEQAQGLVAVGCWMIDTLHYRQVVPSPMLAEAIDLVADVELGDDDVFVDAGPAVEEEVVEELPAVEETVEADEVSESFSEEPEYQAESIEADEVLHEDDAPVEEMPVAAEEPDFDPSATMRVEGVPEAMQEMPPVDVEATPEPEAPPEAEAYEEPEPAPEPEPEPEADADWQAEVTPPPKIEVAPADEVEVDEAAGPALSPEEEAQHSEAQRFARLLISEIKLYNEEEVERGKVARDVYQRLKEDIDRSREMYERRIAEEVRQTSQYFDDELIRILADGDSGALGM